MVTRAIGHDHSTSVHTNYVYACQLERQHRTWGRFLKVTWIGCFYILVTSIAASRQLNQQQLSQKTAESLWTQERSVLLVPGTLAEGTLQGGESRLFHMQLESGQFAQVVVEQKGIDVQLVVLGPDGNQRAHIDRPNGTIGPEVISWITDQEGIYRLRVESVERGSPRGDFTALLATPRTPEARDYERILAEQISAEAEEQRNIATAHALGRGVELYERAVKLWQQLDDPYETAVAFYGLGWCHSVLCLYDEAITDFSSASKIMQDLHDAHGEAITLTGLAYAYMYLGETRKALDNFTQSLSLRRSINNLRGEAMALYGIGSVQALVGEEERALQNFFESLSLRRRVDDKQGEAVTLIGIGKAYRRLGRNQEALKYLSQALDILEHSSNHTGLADVLATIGWVYYSLGQTDKALEYLQKALPLTKDVGDPGGQAMTLYGLARVEYRRGNLSLARDYIDEALRIIESLRAKVSSEQLRLSYFASVQDYYDFYIELLMRLDQLDPAGHHVAAGLQISERSRARSLLDILTEAKADIRQGVAPELLAKEQNLQKQINAKMDYHLRLQAKATGRDQIQLIAEEIQSLRQQYDDVRKLIRKTSPRYASLHYPEPLSLAELQRSVLDQNTVLLEFALGSDHCYLWVVTMNSIEGQCLPDSGQDIREAAGSLIKQLATTGGSMRSFQVAADRVSRMLLPAAAIAHLREKRTVLVVSNGILQSLPFGILSLSSRPQPYVPLIVDHELINLPSASTLAMLRSDLGYHSRRSLQSIVVFADPVFTDEDERVIRSSNCVPANQVKSLESPKYGRRGGQNKSQIAEMLAVGNDKVRAGVALTRLPGTRREAQILERLAPRSKLILDFDATLPAATEPSVSDYQIVHFATHGIAPDDHPEFSGVVLSLVDKQGCAHEGYLGLPIVYNLSLRVDLVVLSACETGLGEEVRGEGLIGLTRGFMYAGSPRVIASLWKVRDNATEELMRRMYTGIFKAGMRPSAALSSAAASMWKDQRWAPSDWAGFVFFGEWQ
jgi:tetratricopeptide (TPR) repeat protein